MHSKNVAEPFRSIVNAFAPHIQDSTEPQMVERTHIPRSEKIEPGTYYVSTDGDLFHRCPKCKVASAMVNHSVTANGEVNASIACFPPCDYHVWGILDGWDYGVKEAGKPVSFTEQTCPGHIASGDNKKICARCGTHIDSLKPRGRK